jgi:DNA-binding transcriptional ArsR family regulator
MADLHEPPRDEITLPAVMAALADPVRVAILRTLAEDGEVVCGTLDVGVSKARPVGTRRHVSIRRDDLDARFPGLLDALLAAAAQR